MHLHSGEVHGVIPFISQEKVGGSQVFAWAAVTAVTKKQAEPSLTEAARESDHPSLVKHRPGRRQRLGRVHVGRAAIHAATRPS
jgi:hypothetical protein